MLIPSLLLGEENNDVIENRENGNEALYQIDEVVVTAGRREMLLRDTPDIVDVIDRKRIEKLNPASTGELLEYATGVSVETGTGSGFPDRSVISINGLAPHYTLVLVDGVRLLTEHIHTGQNIDFIPPESIERIEIMRGAASAQYGSDAIGGIVNIITRKCGDTLAGDIGGAVARYDTYEGFANLFAPPNSAVRISSFANWEESDGHKIKKPAHRVDNMGYERLNLFNRVDVSLGESTDLYAWVNYIDNEMDWFTSPDRTHTRENSSLVTPVAGITHNFSSWLDTTAEVSYSYWDADVNDELNKLLEAKWFTTWQIKGNHTLMGGIDFEWNEFERKAVESHEQNSYAFFFQYDWKLHDKFFIMSALRFDKVESIEAAVSPKISLLYKPWHWLNVRSSIGRGFRAPTLQERYEEGYGHGGYAYRFGNPDLDPEYSTTFTGGVEINPIDRIQLMLYGYYSNLDDMIVPVYLGPWDQNPGIDVWKRINIHEAEVYGFDVKTRVHIFNNLQLEAGYTYTDNKNEGSGRQLPYDPGSSISATLFFSQRLNQLLGFKGFIGVRRVFDRSAWNWKPQTRSDDPSGLTTSLDDYTKLDADSDGVISATELANAEEALKKIDANEDGQLTRDEMFSGPGGPGGRGWSDPKFGRRPGPPPADDGELIFESIPLPKDGGEKKILAVLQDLDRNHRRGMMNVPEEDGACSGC